MGAPVFSITAEEMKYNLIALKVTFYKNPKSVTFTAKCLIEKPITMAKITSTYLDMIEFVGKRALFAN